VKYEIEKLHDTVAPRLTTLVFPSDAWLTSRRPRFVQLDRATASVQPVTLPVPQGTMSTGCEAPFTSSTVPLASAHIEFTQVCPPPQVTPQAPQFALLVARFTQAPLQRVSPLAQGVRQTPSAQLCPLLHARPQAPQFAALVPVLVSQPLPDSPSQLPKPGKHAPTTQLPEAQGRDRVGPPQALPHMPQLPRSLCRSRHTPLHSVCPCAHETTQAPVGADLPAGAGVAAGMPQFALSLCRSRQTPAAVGEPRAARDAAAHAAHLPAAQALPHMPQWARSVWGRGTRRRSGLPWRTRSDAGAAAQTCPAGQALPQAPQWARSLCRSRHTPRSRWCPAAAAQLRTPRRTAAPRGRRCRTRRSGRCRSAGRGTRRRSR
jgi:hypothetical protein